MFVSGFPIKFWILIFMYRITVAIVFPVDKSPYLKKGGDNVCQRVLTHRQRIKTKCGHWGWKRCTAYRSHATEKLECCSGWQNYHADLTACHYAICDTKISAEKHNEIACTTFYDHDYIKYRNQQIMRWSGGRCTSPETCTGCNDGFYSNGPICSICPQIPNCHHRRCTSPLDNICAYCHGEVQDKLYWRAYTSAIDGRKTCREACSWRASSTRCYPGHCTGETTDTCRCVKGYTGHHCEQITEKPKILYNLIKLEDGSKSIGTSHESYQEYDPATQPIWTNAVGVDFCTVEFKGKYTLDEEPSPKPDTTGELHFVTDWRYGIIEGKIKFRLLRGGSTLTQSTTICSGSWLNPVPTNYECKLENAEFQELGFGDFQHNDSLEIELSASNGGYVEVMDRENNNEKTKHALIGMNETRPFTFHFDTDPPYQPCARSGAKGCLPPITVPDSTNNPNVSFTWDDWNDDLSRLHHYQYDVIKMRNNGTKLTTGNIYKQDVTINLNATSESFSLSTPGMYSIIFYSYDNAGNVKTARGLLLFDDRSKIEKQPGKVARVTTASPQTDYEWVSVNTKTVVFEFKDRFINFRHRNNYWLNAVRPYPTVESNYDDNTGNRTKARTENVNAIVDFKVAFALSSTATFVKSFRNLTSIAKLQNQSEVLTVDWVDGERLNLTVRAVDILGTYDEENVTVYRDASPPVIEHLSLTRGKRNNVFVHRTEDFKEMTVEWDAYDYHSGIDSFYWKLFDNFTQTVPEDGSEEYIIAQGNTKNFSSCEAVYGSEPGNCYCTPFWGCFYKRFVLKPDIKNDGGLRVGTDKGVHDYDYYLEVQAKNIAKLVTTKIIKVTIDVTPPHTGVVHDGVNGTFEVDFQQNKTLHAHWDEFFDRESGVLFYLYAFKTSCLNASAMVLDANDSEIFDTKSRYATHHITTDGKYYVTVVAVNRALEPSLPVCSDGVLVDTSTPSVMEIILTNARIKGGLVTNAEKTKVWVLGNNRERRLVANVTDECWKKATIVRDIDLYPVKRISKGLVLVDGYTFCLNAVSAPSVIKVVMPKSPIISMEWTPVKRPGGIFDYEVGVSTTESGGVFPDIMGYVSTKQNAHHKIMHADLPTGSEFYLFIRTTSKSEVEGIQSIGPCIVDTTPPDHSGEISVIMLGDYLVASWSDGDFVDLEDLYNLTFHHAIGHEPFSTDVLNFEVLKGGGSCIITDPPKCTAVLISKLSWQLHGHHTYYVTIKAENTVGLFTLVTSQPYVHDVQLPSKGVVLDVTDGTNEFADTDFQTDTDKLAARWSGFYHPHLNIMYTVCIGTTAGGSDVMHFTPVGSVTVFEKSNITLTVFKTYYFTVEAMTSAGSVLVTSDGVTVVENMASLTDIHVYDGKQCQDKVDDGHFFKHHDQDNRVTCSEELDYQASLNTVQVHWTIPTRIKHYTTDIYWAVEVRSSSGNLWTVIRDFQYTASSTETEAHDFILLPGRSYRSVIKFCALNTCYKPIATDGFTVLSNPPQTGHISLQHFSNNNTQNKEKLFINMTRFIDPDVIGTPEKYDVIGKYEWTLTDNSEKSKTFTKWTSLENLTIIGDQMSFVIDLNGTMDFSRCKRFAVRGYNKAMLSTVVTTDIKSCSAFDPLLIVSNVVIDAVGEPDHDIDGYSKPIFLPRNEYWIQDDIDYTPYRNYISAVWPKLRHHNYNFAVLLVDSFDINTYYLPTSRLSLPDPCSHPDALPGSCGTTSQEFVNVKFNLGVLVHGKRYTVCIHAAETQVQHETYLETLPEVNVCSDGVVVDLTPPQAGKVWIGNKFGNMYQSSTSHMYVNWETFKDIEEVRRIPHSSGIRSYAVGVGTSPGANDIVDFRDVGVVNHVAFHNLRLRSGHKYYATVIGTDFAGWETQKISESVTVDTTPPLKTNKPITITGRYITSQKDVSACWSGVFIDPESGIYSYQWAIGSQPGHSDIMTYVSVFDVECATTDQNDDLSFHEGHAYYINVKAYNGAGMSTLSTSWTFVVDLTPPMAGHVYDGMRDFHSDYKKDSDFQADTFYIAAFWEGFYDPHSVIKQYWISVGTCKHCQNILVEQAIEITQEFVIALSHLGIGLTYYVTVTACNAADLCTSVTSDGVILDDSPPIPGIVQDGTGKLDAHYQADRTYIGAKWFGFTDPQSGIERYEWWVGTSSGNDDLMPTTMLPLREEATNPRITTLPLDKRIYITVRAYNKAGKYSQTTSNGFTIDLTPPTVTAPKLSDNMGSIIENTIVSRTSFKVTWTAEDRESYIERQYLSVKAHRGGEFHLPIEVSGLLREHVFVALDLHDGVNYYVNIVACNGAGLCSHAESSAIFVDSSPPSRGMFAISTDHASDVNRNVPFFMTWTKKAVYLSWLGFADIHSGVKHYMVTVGSSFMNNDMLQNSESAVKVLHSVSGELYDEGHVQTAKIETQNLHAATGDLFISMWAVNSVGLASPVIHSMFNKIPGGILELVRRCDAYSCMGHCVCAPQDYTCPATATCNDKTGDLSLSQLDVVDILNLKSSALHDTDITPFGECLAASWRISIYGERSPLWYEWSVGFSAFSTPEGVFAEAYERVWHDIGRGTTVIFILPRGTSLHDAVSYSFFVRAWYSPDTYAIFKSDGITISKGISRVTSTRKIIKFNFNAGNARDMDYIKYEPFTVSWKNAFINAEENIDKFKIYISTYPGGHDIHQVAEELPGSTTSYNVVRLTLDPRVKMYLNVVGYTHTNVQYVKSSSGFIVDDSNPHAGTVYDGIGFYDIEYQTQNNRVSASWQGFVDLESGVKSYFWCVGLTETGTECGVSPWQNVGLRTLSFRNLTKPLLHGSVIYNKVYAIDFLGHASDTVVSNGIKIDTTPPVLEVMIHEERTNPVKNPSFEILRGKYLSWDDIFSTNICFLDILYQPMYWNKEKESCVAVVSSDTNLAKSGTNILIVRGSVEQEVDGLDMDELYRIRFVTSYLPTDVSANKEGFIQFGNEKYIFILHTKAYRYDDNDDVGKRQNVSWHLHTFYFHPIFTREKLTLGSVDNNTAMLLDDVQIHKVSVNHTNGTTIHSHVVYIHEWGSIHGSWSFVEDESVIIDSQWAIGFTKGGTQIQDFKSVGLKKFALNSKCTLVHNAEIFITVTAVNSAGLQEIIHSSPFLVDLTGPIISEVNDGSDLDLDTWSLDDIIVNWKVEDAESGIKFCEWAVGTQPLGNDIKKFTKTPADTNIDGVFGIGYEHIEGNIIYSTIRCENNAGLQTVKSSDGVKISNKSPSVTNVNLKNIGLSVTEYSEKPGFQSLTGKIRLMWTGFSDFIGMEGFVVSFEGVGTPYSEWKILSYDQTNTYLQLDKLSMKDGNQDVTVKGVNLQLKSSQLVYHNFTVFAKNPDITNAKNIGVIWDTTQKQLKVTWDGVFPSEFSSFYEVSAGTVLGGGNILQWMETTESSLTFGLPPAVKSVSKIKVYINVRAISASGIYVNKSGHVTLKT